MSRWLVLQAQSAPLYLRGRRLDGLFVEGVKRWCSRVSLRSERFRTLEDASEYPGRTAFEVAPSGRDIDLPGSCVRGGDMQYRAIRLGLVLLGNPKWNWLFLYHAGSHVAEKIDIPPLIHRRSLEGETGRSSAKVHGSVPTPALETDIHDKSPHAADCCPVCLLPD